MAHGGHILVPAIVGIAALGLGWHWAHYQDRQADVALAASYDDHLTDDAPMARAARGCDVDYHLKDMGNDRLFNALHQMHGCVALEAGKHVAVVKQEFNKDGDEVAEGKLYCVHVEGESGCFWFKGIDVFGKPI